MEQRAHQDIPGKFFSSQNPFFNFASLQKYFPDKNQVLLEETIIGIAAGLKEKFPEGLLLPPVEAFKRIASECNRLDEETFEVICLNAFKNFDGPNIRKINEAWFEIARLIQIGIKPKLQSEIEWSDEEKEKNEEEETAPLKLVPKRTTQDTPRPLPEKKPSPVTQPYHPIQDYIFDHAPSINYLKVFVFISRHTKNRFSQRGRKVYPYTQYYAARSLGIPLRTISRIFSWLHRRGIIFKRTSENPDKHWAATWFVCTSWKQSTYFRDPEGRRPKKGSRRSRRK